MQTQPTPVEAGPFIVTTRRPLGVSKSLEPACGVSRRAVATLEEAVDLTIDLGWNPANSRETMGRFLLAARKTPPLDDGTVIEVAAVTWEWIGEDLSVIPAVTYEPAAILERWNAAHA